MSNNDKLNKKNIVNKRPANAPPDPGELIALGKGRPRKKLLTSSGSDIKFNVPNQKSEQSVPQTQPQLISPLKSPNTQLQSPQNQRVLTNNNNTQNDNTKKPVQSSIAHILSPSPAHQGLLSPTTLSETQGFNSPSTKSEGEHENNFAVAMKDYSFFLQGNTNAPINLSEADKKYSNVIQQVPQIFHHSWKPPHLFQIMISWLRKDGTTSTVKRSQEHTRSLSILACHVFMQAYVNVSEWPTDFIKVYLDDAFGDRIWVDSDDPLCKDFVENIETVFPHPVSSPATDETARVNRYTNEQIRESVKHEVATLLNNYIASVVASFDPHPHSHHSHIVPVNPKNSSKIFGIATVYKDIKIRLADLVEEWLNISHPNSMRFAKELLFRLVASCRDLSKEDLATMTSIIKWKLKPMHSQLYVDALSQLLKNNPEYPAIAFRFFVMNEVTAAKAQMQYQPILRFALITFKSIARNSELILGEILQQVCLPDLDLIQSVGMQQYQSVQARAILVIKRVLKSLQSDIGDYSSLCRTLLEDRAPDTYFSSVSQTLAQSPALESAKSLFVSNLVDLTCFVLFVSVPQAMYDTPSAQVKEKELSDVRTTVAKIQMEAAKWFHVAVPKYLISQSQSGIPLSVAQNYTLMLKKLLLLEVSGTYFGSSNDTVAVGTLLGLSQEHEKNLFKLLTSSIPVFEETITRIVLITLTKLPLPTPEALEILHALVRRAASYGTSNTIDSFNLRISNGQLVEGVLKLSVYHPPSIGDDILGQYPPFAVSAWFWDSCLLLVILAAFNPDTIGAVVWGIPTLKILVEMLVIKNWVFPPFVPKAQGTNPQLALKNLLATEAQLQRNEKDQILALETVLAQVTRPNAHASPIEEANSILLHQLTLFNLEGPARPPPQTVIKKLEILDTEFRLAIKFAASRNPDFVVDIMNRQGTQQSLGWLIPIIHNEPETLDVLPVSCLCELLLHYVSTVVGFNQPATANTYNGEIARLLIRFIKVITAAQDNQLQLILDFFLSRLSSSKQVQRAAVKKSLATLIIALQTAALQSTAEVDLKQLLLSLETESDFENPSWLEKLSLLGIQQQSQNIVMALSNLRKALNKETSVQALNAYIHYLYGHSVSNDDIFQLGMSMSSFLADREIVADQLLTQTMPNVTTSSPIYTILLKLYTKILGLCTCNQTSVPPILSGLGSQSYAVEVVKMKSGSTSFLMLPRIILNGIICLLSSNQALFFDENNPFYALYLQLVSQLFNRDSNEVSVLPITALQSPTPPFLPSHLIGKHQASRLILSNNQVLVESGLKVAALEDVCDILCGDGLLLASVELVLDHLDKATDFPFVEAHVQAKLSERLSFFWSTGIKYGHKFASLAKINSEQSPNKLFAFSNSDATTTKMANDKSTIGVVQTKDIEKLVDVLAQSSSPQPISLEHVGLVADLVCKHLSIGKSPDIFERILKAVGKHGTTNIKYHQLLPILYILVHHFPRNFELQEYLSKLRAQSMESSFQATITLLMAVLGIQHSAAEQFGSNLLQTKERNQFCDLILDSVCRGSISAEILLNNSVIWIAKQPSSHQKSYLELLLEILRKLGSENRFLSEKSGVLLDTLLLLHPQVVDISQNIWALFPMIFHNSAMEHTKSFLMSYLCHNGSWNSISTVFKKLMDSPVEDNGCDFESLLKFVECYLYHPRSWNGYCDSAVERNSGAGLNLSDLTQVPRPTLFTFDRDSISTLCDYTMHSFVAQNRFDQRRANMLLVCASQPTQQANIHTVILRTLSIMDTTTNLFAQKLLQHTYFSFPSVAKELGSAKQIEPMQADEQLTQIDLVLHGVVKKFLSQDAYIQTTAYKICRRLAWSHPSIVIRYLPTINAVIAGRANLSHSEFLERGYHRLFLHVLSILDVLRPAVFESSCVDTILKPYLQLLEDVDSQVQNKQFHHLLNKLIDFLCHYASISNEKAQKILAHKHALLNLRQATSEPKKIDTLLEVCQDKFTILSKEISLSKQDVAMIHSHICGHTNFWDVAFKHNTASLCSIERDTKIFTTLTELDKISAKSVGILQPFIASFLNLTHHNEEAVRNLSYKLLLRWLHHNPSEIEHVIHQFLSNLDGDDDICGSALQHIDSFWQVAEDQSELVLEKLFERGHFFALMQLIKSRSLIFSPT